MRSDFKTVTIDQAVELIIDHRGRTPKKLGGDFAELGVQVISAKNVYDGRLHPGDNLRFVPPEMAARWMPTQLRDGDVLLTSEAPLGQVAYIDGDFGYCLGQRLFALRARPDVANGRFLYYTLISPQVQGRLHARATGTTVQGIKQSELRQIELELPDTAEQARIVSVLGALDDKIDSNRRLAVHLEETAATVFRAWFVDFVGVDEYEESAVGPIPSGWSVARLDQLATINEVSLTARSHPGRITYIDISSVGTRSVEEVQDLAFDVAPSRARRVVRSGDTIISTVRPERRSLAFIHDAMPDMTASTGFAVVTPTRGAPTFVYQWATSDACIDHLVAAATGSAYPAVNPRELAAWRVPVPPDNGVGFEEVARPIEAS